MKHQLEIIIFLACFCLSSLHIQAKTTINISGSIKDEESTEGIPFSNITILRLPDSTLIKGSSSDFNGNFSIEITNSGSNILRISVIGYESKSIVFHSQASIDSLKFGHIYLKQKAILLDEIVTIGERIKAKSESNKTTYYINKKITDASNTGMDVIKHVPGIQVDLMQNISLDGNQNISILVDGKERDRHFLNQIDVSKIDKLEVIRSPGSEYDANITGIINIVSKNKEESGINGQLLLDIPASGKEIYSFPNYNITYCIKNLSIYTSYNGELNYFDIEEYKFWRFLDHDNLDYYQSTYKLRQKNGSHRFHFGLDYLFKNNNELGIYVNLNPYSSEFDGNIESIVNFSNNHFSGYNANKEDTDKNLSHFISFFYKHHFNSKNELAADFSLYGLNAENLTRYTGNFYNTEQNIINNAIEPSQHKMNLKIDVKTTINEKIVLKSGLKIESNNSKDKLQPDFEYSDDKFAVYFGCDFSLKKLELNTGLRMEYRRFDLKEKFDREQTKILPHLTIFYRINRKENIKLTYRNALFYPGFYHLNPYTSSENNFSIKQGNPLLEAENKHQLSIVYSLRIKNNFLSGRLFYTKTNNQMGRIKRITENDIYETNIANLGDRERFGIHLSGSLKAFHFLSVNPYLKIFRQKNTVNDRTKNYAICSEDNLALESSVSAIVSLKNDFTFSLLFRYNSPVNYFQHKRFSDALYFLSMDKKLNKNVKIGLTCANPFSRAFMYSGVEIKHQDYYYLSKGTLKISYIPLWIKFNYQFSSGKKQKKFERKNHNTLEEKKQKKGF